MRILSLHAHPDDESITMGGTLARHAAAGDQVCIVTATLGEEGEVIGPRWQGLVASAGDQLGGYRAWELTAALRELGVTDHRYLGGAGRFRDSGMVGTPAADHPRALIRGESRAAALTALTGICLELRPEVLLCYPADGGYGHPDHVAVARLALAAAVRTGVPRVLASVRPRRVLADAVAGLPVPAGLSAADPAQLGYLIAADPGGLIAVDVTAAAPLRARALAAHATQVQLAAGGFALSNRILQPLLPVEYYQVVSGPPAPAGATELGAGL